MKLSLIIASVVLTTSTLTMVAQASEKAETVKIVSENGFKVLKDNDTSKSTIACKMINVSKDDVTCKNLFDSKDVIVLEKNEVKKSWKKGDNILVTFKDDAVVKTIKNNKTLTYTINDQEKAGKAVKIVSENGYKVLKDTDTSKSTIACKITKLSKDDVTCKNLFDSKDVISLEQTEVKKGWKKGDHILVTFTGDWITKTNINDKKLVYNVKVQEAK